MLTTLPLVQTADFSSLALWGVWFIQQRFTVQVRKVISGPSETEPINSRHWGVNRTGSQGWASGDKGVNTDIHKSSDRSAQLAVSSIIERGNNSKTCSEWDLMRFVQTKVFDKRCSLKISLILCQWLIFKADGGSQWVSAPVLFGLIYLSNLWIGPSVLCFC